MNLSKFIERGYLVSPEFLENAKEDFDEEEFLEKISQKLKTKDRPIILNEDIKKIAGKAEKIASINWQEFEKSKALLEKGKNGKIYETFLNLLEYETSDKVKGEVDKIIKEVGEPETVMIEEEKDTKPNVIVLESYEEEPKSIEVKDFVMHFRKRYETMREILKGRRELQNVLSINKLPKKKDARETAIIGMIFEKRTTGNGNLILNVEDLTGRINVLINKDRFDVFEKGKNLVEDEVIGITGVLGNNILFANNIINPDSPIMEAKKSNDEVYAAFISDLHIGSRLFMEKNFMKFLDWINLKSGSREQKRIAEMTKYLFVVGDLVDGVGIYPEQDKELEIKDLKRQYVLFEKLMKMVRQDVNIIICPGNHDAQRLSVPQPKLKENYVSGLYDVSNIKLVSNPSLVNIHSSKEFSGYDVLLYHGYGFHYYIDNVENLRKNKARDNPALVQKFLLQKRHLVPTHNSTLYVPETTKDHLVIRNVPDIFVSGEMHRPDVNVYNKTINIVCSCWQEKTEFQEKTGNNPDPAKVPVVNLKTREIKMLRFAE